MLENFYDSEITITKRGGKIALANGDVVSMGVTSDDDLDDLWIGISYNGQEYDVNIWSNRLFSDGEGFSACVYGVDGDCHVDTSVSVPVRNVDVS